MPNGIEQIGCCRIGKEAGECLKCLQMPGIGCFLLAKTYHIHIHMYLTNIQKETNILEHQLGMPDVAAEGPNHHV